MKEIERETAEVLQQENFTDIADIIVSQYISEISTIKAKEGKLPSFDELYGKLRTLNEELSFRAARIICKSKREHTIKEEEMVANYQQIIARSVVGFVAQLG